MIIDIRYYHYNCDENVAEFIKKFDIKYATACILSETRTSTLQTIRYFAIPYRAPKTGIKEFSGHLKVAEMFAPVQLGYTVYDRLALLIVSGREIPLNILWSINRLGSKESTVLVDNVVEKKIEAQKINVGDYVKVNTYVPLDVGAIEAPSSFIVEKMPFPLNPSEWKSWFSLRKQENIERAIVIPIPQVYVHLRTLKKCYKLSLNKYIVIFPII